MSALREPLERAATFHARLLFAVALVRLFFVGGVLAGALALRHVLGWIAFGVVALLYGGGALLTAAVSRGSLRATRRLAAEPERLAWLHVRPEPVRVVLARLASPREPVRLLELHERDGDTRYLHAPEGLARAVLDAVRALEPPVPITETAEGRAHRLSRHELGSELARIEALLAPGGSRAARGLATELGELCARWRTALDAADDETIAAATKLARELRVKLLAAASYDEVRGRLMRRAPHAKDVVELTMDDGSYLREGIELTNALEALVARVEDRAPAPPSEPSTEARD